ncbi:UNVERIFIED_CONTAM: hypothetical protein NCL1_42757 [Trichonephila clavipes]
MSDNEQRCAIKFCFRHGHNATETFAKYQQAYGDSVLSSAQFFEERESIEDKPRSGRPSVSKTTENVVSPGSCAFRSSLDSQNDWGRVEFESHHHEKDLRQNGTKKPFSVNRFLAIKNIPVAPQPPPPYYPDLSPCDFFLFPKLKNHLKEYYFGTPENIQTAVSDQLKAIPISEFHQCYEEWKNVTSAEWLQNAVTLKETMLNCK